MPLIQRTATFDRATFNDLITRIPDELAARIADEHEELRACWELVSEKPGPAKVKAKAAPIDGKSLDAETLAYVNTYPGNRADTCAKFLFSKYVASGGDASEETYRAAVRRSLGRQTGVELFVDGTGKNARYKVKPAEPTERGDGFGRAG